MSNYPSNSHKSREAAKQAPVEKKVEKVVKGNAKVKKKNGLTKVADSVITEDIHNVKNYVIMDVLIPAFKKAISDIVANGIDMILYGETGRTKKGYGSSSYVSYDKKYRYGERSDERSSYRSIYSLDDIVLDYRDDAEDVLRKMDELIDMYDAVSVADLYDLVGLRCNYTDNKYGWTNIRNAEIVHTRDGWTIKMPRATPL